MYEMIRVSRKALLFEALQAPDFVCCAISISYLWGCGWEEPLYIYLVIVYDPIDHRLPAAKAAQAFGIPLPKNEPVMHAVVIKMACER